MNDRGQIASFPTPEAARAAGFNLPLSEAEAELLKAAPEEKRVETHVANRHAERTSPSPALAATLGAMAILASGVPDVQRAVLEDSPHRGGYEKGPVSPRKGSTFTRSPKRAYKKRIRQSR